MKKLYILLLVLAVTMLSGPGILADDPPDGDIESNTVTLPGGGWWTSVTLQNPNEATTVNFSMEANDLTDQTGGPYAGTDCAVAPNGAVIYNPALAPNFPGGPRIGFSPGCGENAVDNVPTGYAGGVVISATQQLVSVVSVGNNKANDLGIDGGYASAFYQGPDSSKIDTTLNFPVAKNNFFNQTTTFYIQAVEDASVTIEFSDGTSDGPVDIAAGQTHIFSPVFVNMASDASYAAKVTSTTGQIAGSVIEHPHAPNGPSAFALSTRAFTPGEADTSVFAPAIKNSFFGGITGLSIQATGGDVQIIVHFAITNQQVGATCFDDDSAPIDLADGQNVIFGGSAGRNLPDGFGDGCFGAATINVTGGTGKVVATVNEASAIGKAVYSAFPASVSTRRVAVPLVKETFFGQRTAVVVQAVGNSTEETNIEATYVESSTGPCASGCTIAPNGGGAGSTITSGGSSVNFRRLQDFSSEYTVINGVIPPANTNNAVVITSSNLPIVALAQEGSVSSFGTSGFLDVKNYESFNLPDN